MLDNITEAQAVVLLLTFLALKHFVVDFLLQQKYQYSNKGTYGHPGGLLHAGLHGLGTIAALWLFGDAEWAILMAVFDSFVHYHVDWLKTNINAKMGWGPSTHEEFWWLLGADQLLHSLTYIVIIGWTIGAF
jgi:hypothetical protein